MRVWSLRPRLRAIAIRFGAVGAAFIALSIAHGPLPPGVHGIPASVAAAVLALATMLGIATRRARGVAPSAFSQFRKALRAPQRNIVDAGTWQKGAWLCDRSGREHWIRCNPTRAREIVARALESNGVRSLRWSLAEVRIRPFLSWSGMLAVPWVARRALLVPWVLVLGVLAFLPTTVSFWWLLPLALSIVGTPYALGVEIGTDGVLLRGPLFRRWIRFTQVRRVRVRPGGIVLCSVDGDVEIPEADRSARKALGRELRRRVTKAKRDLRALESLRRLPSDSKKRAYRVAPLPVDALLDVALSPEHTPTDRIAAASALSDAEFERTANEAWQTLDACIDPATRRAVRRLVRT